MKYWIFSIFKLMEAYNVVVYFLFFHIIVTTIQNFNVNVCLNTIFTNKFQIYLLSNCIIFKYSKALFNLCKFNGRHVGFIMKLMDLLSCVYVKFWIICKLDFEWILFCLAYFTMLSCGE
jgi:hypothetical protein